MTGSPANASSGAGPLRESFQDRRPQFIDCAINEEVISRDSLGKERSGRLVFSNSQRGLGAKIFLVRGNLVDWTIEPFSRRIFVRFIHLHVCLEYGQ
jgi:hypothetical protein